ncbi:hypothetical protein [Fuerstiella marisgermanici]|uniref:Uncharacterized protein n=1 Tax=Fuerstiella marisgermanici TaxID=1891926 RepID=A0A1P8WGY9_9PLAN|nr:hypothetical protein [Fuerstiella marisgermanici]APZ93287.1 hypothetical protein Fuma_02904 [Fuerstiella marisgermanici]
MSTSESKNNSPKTNVEKPYKVQMRTTVGVSILVGACDVDQAIKKASAWTDLMVQTGESWFGRYDDEHVNNAVGERFLLEWWIFQIVCGDFDVRLAEESDDSVEAKIGEPEPEPDPEFFRELESMN